MTTDIELGERIAGWRHARGWSQAELADKLELTAGAVSNWEVNSEVPTGKNLQKLVDALEVTMQQFWGRIPPPKKKRAA